MMNNSSILPKGKVLITDDDDDSRLLLNILLSQEGWEVIEAKDGNEALLKTSEQSPDIVILDNRMPGLSGTEVYQELKEKNSNLAIILITAYPDIKLLADSLGITYFLTKPFNFSDLFDIMELAYNSLSKKEARGNRQ